MTTESTSAAVKHHCEFQLSETDGVEVVGVEGALDWVSAPGLRDLLHHAGSDQRLTIIDLTATDSIDSAGNGIILAAIGHRYGQGGQIALVVTQPSELEVLDALQVPDVAPVCDSLAAAAAKLKAHRETHG